MAVIQKEHFDLLRKVKAGIKHGREMMGSKWNNCEAETIALQIISGCANVLETHGEAFSWQGKGTLASGPHVDNPGGVQRLINDGSIVIESYEGDAEPSKNVVMVSGKPQIFRITPSLLHYAASMVLAGRDVPVGEQKVGAM